MSTELLSQLVMVEWADIVVEQGWTEEAKIKPHECVSVGFLTYEGDDYVVVSATKGVNGTTQFNQHISIPVGCIRAVKDLKASGADGGAG